jgi:MFS family permease
MTAANLLRPRSLIFAVGFLCLLFIYILTVAPDITWANDGADGGDLISAASQLGVAHPSGYPTYLLLAHLFQRLPFGTLAARTALLSAVSAAVAAVLVTVAAGASSASGRRYAWVGAALAGLAFGLSPLLWSQAVIAEVYGLHTAFSAAIVVLMIAVLTDGPSTWKGALGGLLLGIALGNHLTIIFLVPPWLWVVGRHKGHIQWRALVITLIAVALGLLVYLYIPLRAQTQPLINWGNANTVENFFKQVSGGSYKSLIFGLPPQLLPVRIQAWAGLMIAQFSWPGLMLALYGLFFGHTITPIFKLITVWMVVVYSIFAIGYGTSDSQAYLLPAFLAIALWLAWGAATALQSLPAFLKPVHPVLIAIGLLVIFLHAVATLPQVDASRDHAAKDYAVAIMDTAPASAIIFTSNDRDTFPLWYMHFALKQRLDITIVVQPMLTLPWYSDNLHANYPQLVLPGTQLTSETIMAANDGPWCFTQYDSPVPLTCTSQ